MAELDIPRGDLFYPSCGTDTLEPLKLFVGKVNTFHFCDSHKIGLPPINKIGYHRPPFIESLSEGLEGQIMASKIRTLDRDEEKVSNERPFARILNDLTPSLYEEKWVTKDHPFSIKAYHMDALSAFKQIDRLSVFFYRGDSLLELGSGITWLGELLFNQVLEKLVDGGFIITDGSNPDPHYLDSPWKNLYRHSHWSFPPLKEEEVPESFIYHDFQFEWVGKISPRYGDTYVWQLKRVIP